MTIRFALLGAGRIGKVHARAITSNPAARLVAVADAMEKAAQDIASQYGCEIRTIDDGTSGVIRAGCQLTGVDPPPHGVVAHSEQHGGLADPKTRHDTDSSSASEKESCALVRR